MLVPGRILAPVVRDPPDQGVRGRTRGSQGMNREHSWAKLLATGSERGGPVHVCTPAHTQGDTHGTQVHMCQPGFSRDTEPVRYKYTDT